MIWDLCGDVPGLGRLIIRDLGVLDDIFVIILVWVGDLATCVEFQIVWNAKDFISRINDFIITAMNRYALFF